MTVIMQEFLHYEIEFRQFDLMVKKAISDKLD